MLHLLCTSLNLPRPTAPVLVDSGGTECKKLSSIARYESTTPQKLIVDRGGTECMTLQKIIVATQGGTDVGGHLQS